MKRLNILWGILLCTFFSGAYAQVTPTLHQTLPVKPALFSQLPERFIINSKAIEKIFSAASSGPVSIAIANDMILEGTIIEKLQRSPKMVTVNIKLTNFDQALFTISKITDNDNTITYRGRIINIKYGDALIVSAENDHLYFLKEKQSLFLVE